MDNQLKNLRKEIRYKLVEVSHFTKTPHLGSCLSSVDLLITLYWRILNLYPDNPKHAERDYFLLGKGHAASALYTVLAYRGFFNIDKLMEHGKDNSAFEEHPGVNAPPGVEAVSGSLGHALSLATGMAKAAKIQDLGNTFYVLVGDGELNEGTIWEAAMFAPAHQLSNLVLVIDFNKLQGTGESCNIMQLEPLDEKFKSFGWFVKRVNGHCLTELEDAFNQCKLQQNKPSVVIADTIKGAGISFMEGDNNWHYRIPSQEELPIIADELGIS